MTASNGFSKRDTAILKGIAILTMVWHHTVTNNPALTYAQNIQEYGGLVIPVVIGQMCKICVPLFAIFSGIGMTYGYKKLEDRSWKQVSKYVLSHLVQLYSVWFVAILTTYISFAMIGKDYVYFYGEGIKSVAKCVLDILGVAGLTGTRTVIGVGWFMSATVVFYILFPVLCAICEKIGLLAAVLAYIPWIIYMIKPEIPMHTDSWLFYLCAFVLGIVVAQKNYLDKIKENKSPLVIVLTVLAVVLTAILRIAIALPGDVFLSAAIIAFITAISRFNIPIFWDILVLLGENSAFMWLMHGHIMHSYIFMDVLFFEFVVVSFLSLAVSLLLKKLQEVTGYLRLVKKVRENLK